MPKDRCVVECREDEEEEREVSELREACPTPPNPILPLPIPLNVEGVIPVNFLNCALRWATLLKPLRWAGRIFASCSPSWT